MTARPNLVRRDEIPVCRPLRRGTIHRALVLPSVLLLPLLWLFLLADLLPLAHPSPTPRSAASANPTASTPLAAPNSPLEVDSPILLWGLTGREEFSQAYVFEQENNFYYLTGHNEEGAGLIILPSQKNSANAASMGRPPGNAFSAPEKS